MSEPTSLPEPVAYLRIVKKWDGEPIPVVCNESHERACGVVTEPQLKAYGAAEYQRGVADSAKEIERLKAALNRHSENEVLLRDEALLRERYLDVYGVTILAKLQERLGL